MKSLVFAIALCFSALSHAQDAAALHAQGTAAYQAGDYAKAAEAFRAITQSGIASSDAYFNLGTAELRAGRRGAAIHALERALRLDPDDADAAYNLAEAQKGNIDKVVGAREEEPLVERVGERVPAQAMGWAFLSSWIVGLGWLASRRFVRRGRGPFAALGVVGLVVAAASGALLGAAAWYEAHGKYAVVVTPVTAVREGPAADFKSAFEIHEGLKVRVVRVERGFLRIRLPNGAEGWAAQKDVPII